MSSQIHIVGRDTNLEGTIERAIKETNSKALGLAVAYVSVYGAEFIRRIKYSARISHVRLIADIRDAVSHPVAFKLGLNDGWKVRVVNSARGIFHPKLYVAGDAFASDGTIKNSQFYVVGSNNLSKGGLKNNIECCVGRRSSAPLIEASEAFKFLWSCGRDLDAAGLKRYEKYFAKRNRMRAIGDIETLGVADELPRTSRSASIAETMPIEAASTVWVGLRTTTGGYRFQIEFPKRAGQVFAKIVGEVGIGKKIKVQFEDGSVQQMTFDYYQNAMYRLNVPNSAPGVLEARRQHQGIALIERVFNQAAPLRFKIVRRADQISEVVRRSRALGTLGQTPTRQYGWF